MPTVTYNSQCFLIDQQRVFVVGAAMPHTCVPQHVWDERLAAIRQAGFNLVRTNCPWRVFEPRRNRFDENAIHDLRRFIERCGEHDLYVMLEPGPFVGDGLDGGGLPHWLMNGDFGALRDADPAFTERVGTYFRTVIGPLTDLAASQGGPLLLLQVEDGWTCGNEDVARRYLGGLTHVLQECGFNIPIVASNDLWVSADAAGANFDAWRGRDGLLAHLRQLHAVQPNAPRLVSALHVAERAVWGEKPAPIASATDIGRRFAEVLAAGGHPIVTPMHDGIAHDWMNGRSPGGTSRFHTTARAVGAPIGEAGERTERYTMLKRMAMFASQFGGVLADIEPSDQVSTLDAPNRDRATDTPSVIPLRGGQGDVTFVFPTDANASMTLLLDDGRTLPITPGPTPVAWYVKDIDLRGAGRLDYANVSPWALVGGRTLVFFGAAKSDVLLAINGRPLEASIPGGKTPTIVEHEQFNIVLLHHDLVDATYVDDEFVHVGCAGLDAEGDPIPDAGYKQCTIIQPDGGTTRRPMTPVSNRMTTRNVKSWSVCPLTSYVDGSSPRFASLAGPSSLVDCGALTGYGWYRVILKKGFDKKRTVLLPNARDRVHLYTAGVLRHIVGVGPDASTHGFEMRLSDADPSITMLVDNLGRFSAGNDLHDTKGVLDHLIETKALKVGKPKAVEAAPVSPFQLRGFIEGLPDDAVSETTQIAWSFSHLRKSRIVMVIDELAIKGTILLNDEPYTYFAGATGAGSAQIVFDPADERFRRGSNVVRFAPDARQEPMTPAVIGRTVKFHDTVEVITDGATWQFAKWDVPDDEAFEPMGDAPRSLRIPTWYAGRFSTPGGHLPVWIETSGLSKGCVIVNDHFVGRYFTSTSHGKTVGPQTRLWIPRGWLLDDDDNHLVIFDEHGATPEKVRIAQRPRGDLDG